MTAVVGFMNLDGFLGEIAGTTDPVRVEAYHKSVGASDGSPVEYYTFFVEVASETTGGVMVFRFTVGKCSTVGYDPPMGKDKFDALHERAAQAAEKLHRFLEGKGYDVRAGLIAAAAESKTAGTMPAFLQE